MPIDAKIAAGNAQQTARLRNLIAKLTPSQYEQTLPRGWKVRVAIGHIGFWDRQRLCLLRRWFRGDWCSGGYDGELFNEVLLPVLESLPDDKVGDFAIRTAEEIDALLLELPDDFLQQALARPNAPNIDRGGHREYHLDRIEQTLGISGYEK